MKQIVLNKKTYESFKDFYTDIYNKLDGKNNHDFDFCKTPLGYNADTLNEFLWYYHNDNINYIFLNFDKDRIALEKNYNDYEFNIVIKVFERFVKEYPNNKLEFKMEEDKK